MFIELGEYRDSEKCLAELLEAHIELTDEYKQAKEYSDTGYSDRALEILAGMDQNNKYVKELTVKCYEKIYYSADCHGDPAAMPLHLWMDQAGIR